MKVLKVFSPGEKMMLGSTRDRKPLWGLGSVRERVKVRWRGHSPREADSKLTPAVEWGVTEQEFLSGITGRADFRYHVDWT